MRDKFRGKRAKIEQGTVLSVSLTPDGAHNRGVPRRTSRIPKMLIIAYIFAHVFHMPLNVESIADFVCKSPLRCVGDSYSIDVICFQCSIAARGQFTLSLAPSLSPPL